MADQLERFRTSLHEWLVRNELDHDSHFYTAAEWRERGEELLCGAELVLVTEGGLHFLLNYNFSHAKVDELFDLCESFGYWFEIGHSWSVGFYRDELADTTSVGDGYRDKLQDARWKRKAELIKRRAGNKCEDCGSTEEPLEAHHCWYRYGLEPWQYPLDAFRCLCTKCHKARPAVEHRLRTLMARFTEPELICLREAIENLFHWYDRDVALTFLRAIGPDERTMIAATTRLASFKTEPGASV